MNKTIVTFALMCFYAPVAVIACSSSSSSDGGGGSVSSIDSSKQVQNLSDAEKTQYCKDTHAYLASQRSEADTKKFGCYVHAYNSITQGGTPPKTDADLQAQCKTAYDACIAAPAQTSTADAGATTDPCSNATKDYANCTATVGEINTCFQDTATAAKASFAAYDTACSNIQLDGGGVDKSSADKPASCKTINSKCPTLKL